MKSLGYPLAAICLSEKQCDAIMRPVLNAALPKMGINQKTGRKYIYGPPEYQGLAIPNLYTDLGVARMQLLLHHGNRDTHLGKSIQAIIEGHQLECGSLKSILCLDYKKYGILISDSIIKHAWEFLNGSNLIMETSHALPKRLRENDESIMDSILEKTLYSPLELEEKNSCRMYLNVITTADITEGDGRQVTLEAIEGRRDEFRVSKYHWPNIPRPPETAWKKWRGALDLTILRPDSRFLQKPLKNWICTPHQKWQWFLDSYGVMLYHYKDGNYFAHPPFGRQLRSSTCHRIRGQKSQPDLATLKRTTVEIVHGWMIYSHGALTTSTQTDQVSSTNENDPEGIWNQAPSWVKDTLRNVFLPTTSKPIADAILRGTCVALTDGSYDPSTNLATACWIIESDENGNRAKGASQTPGNETDMDAYRAELYGIYCILLSIKYIIDYFQIDGGSIKLVCDCKGALTRAVIYDNRPTTRHPNYDLLWAIFDLRDDLDIDITWEHVKGHQDDAELDRELTHLEKLNCEADAGAKEYLTYVKTHRNPPVTKLYGSQWRLKSVSGYIYKNFSSQIYLNRHGDKLREHIKSKQGYSEETMQSIDWQTIGETGRSLPLHIKTWLTKHVGRYSATGRQMKRRSEWKNSRCPRCMCPNEDSNHITECQATSATETLHDEVLKFEKELNRLETAYLISDILTTTLFDDTDTTFSSHIGDYDGSIPEEIYNMICDAAKEQDEIGRTGLLHGHLVQKWRIAQEALYRLTPGCRRNGRTWAKRVVKELYTITKAMWDHQNASIFPSTSTTSTNRKKKIWHDVKIELKIGDKGIRDHEMCSICFDKKSIKAWTPESQEIWLKHVQNMRDRAIADWKEHNDRTRTNRQQKLYDKRSSRLHISASRRCHDWKMKHHNKTLSQYLHSTEELKRQPKRRKLATR